MDDYPGLAKTYCGIFVVWKRWLLSGKVQWQPMVGQTFKYENAVTAYETIDHNPQFAIKTFSSTNSIVRAQRIAPLQQ